MLSFDIEDVAVAPEMSAGDLLLLRGDMIHKTHHDVDLRRVAVSFRTMDAFAEIRLSRLLGGASVHKFVLLCVDVGGTMRTLNKFAATGRGEMTAQELFSDRDDDVAGPPSSLTMRERIQVVLKHKMALEGKDEIDLVSCWCETCQPVSEMLAQLAAEQDPGRTPSEGLPRIRLDPVSCCGDLRAP